METSDFIFDVPETSDIESNDNFDVHITAENSYELNQNEEYDSDDLIPLSEVAAKSKTCRKKQKNSRKWQIRDSQYGPGSLPPFLGTEKVNIQGDTPVQYFLFFFSPDIIEEIVFQTNLFATQNDKPNLGFSREELLLFMGVNIVMSYIRYPRVRLYWISDQALRMNLIADSISVNRFEQLLRFLHFSDNTELSSDNPDKLKKIRPFLDKLQRNFLAAAESEEYQAIDEQIIPLKGRLGIKQYLPKKPKKWGIKVWVRAGISGYMYRFEIYQGSGGGRDVISDLGACADVVLRLSSDLVGKNHKLFFYNLFCSLDLLEQLRDTKIWATGTLISNRLANAVNLLPPDKELKQMGRGTSRVVTSDSGVTIVKWLDSSSLHIASTCAGREPQNRAKRWCKSTKTILEVDRPFCVQYYNKNMGGVDLMDQLLALYPLRRRNKKWYIRVFMHFMDVAIVNSWILFKKQTNASIDLLEFKASVARGLINLGLGIENKRGRPRSATPPGILKKRLPMNRAPDEIRRDPIGHWPKLTGIKNARRCHSPACQRKTKYICKRCNEPCCPDCFDFFHTKKK